MIDFDLVWPNYPHLERITVHLKRQGKYLPSYLIKSVLSIKEVLDVVELYNLRIIAAFLLIVILLMALNLLEM